jgi:hypothetical protein
VGSICTIAFTPVVYKMKFAPKVLQKYTALCAESFLRSRAQCRRAETATIALTRCSRCNAQVDVSKPLPRGMATRGARYCGWGASGAALAGPVWRASLVDTLLRSHSHEFMPTPCLARTCRSIRELRVTRRRARPAGVQQGCRVGTNSNGGRSGSASGAWRNWVNAPAAHKTTPWNGLSHRRAE